MDNTEASKHRSPPKKNRTNKLILFNERVQFFNTIICERKQQNLYIDAHKWEFWSMEPHARAIIISLGLWAALF